MTFTCFGLRRSSRTVAAGSRQPGKSQAKKVVVNHLSVEEPEVDELGKHSSASVTGVGSDNPSILQAKPACVTMPQPAAAMTQARNGSGQPSFQHDVQSPSQPPDSISSRSSPVTLRLSPAALQTTEFSRLCGGDNPVPAGNCPPPGASFPDTRIMAQQQQQEATCHPLQPSVAYPLQAGQQAVQQQQLQQRPGREQTGFLQRHQVPPAGMGPLLGSRTIQPREEPSLMEQMQQLTSSVRTGPPGNPSSTGVSQPALESSSSSFDQRVASALTRYPSSYSAASASERRDRVAELMSAGGSDAGSSGGGPGGTVSLRQTSHYTRLPKMRTFAGSRLEGVELGPLLGKGSFGCVYKGRWKGSIVAVKILEHSLIMQADIWREANVSRSITHPAIIVTYLITTVRVNLPGTPSAQQSPVIQLCSKDSAITGLGERPDRASQGDGEATAPAPVATPTVLSGPALESAMAARQEIREDELDTLQGGDVRETWLLLEYCDRGSLQRAVERGKLMMKPPGSGPDMLHVMMCLLDIASGMAYLHTMGVLHGDLKSANVLLKSTATDIRGYVCKLADFGMSRELAANKSHVSTRTYGTISYMAPELLSLGKFAKAADVYSFSILMWEMCTGEGLYDGMTVGQVLYAVVYDEKRPSIPSHTPPAFAELMRDCWKADPRERPDFDEILSRLQPQHDEVRAARRASAPSFGTPPAVTPRGATHCTPPSPVASRVPAARETTLSVARAEAAMAAEAARPAEAAAVAAAPDTACTAQQAQYAQQADNVSAAISHVSNGGADVTATPPAVDSASRIGDASLDSKRTHLKPPRRKAIPVVNPFATAQRAMLDAQGGQPGKDTSVSGNSGKGVVRFTGLAQNSNDSVSTSPSRSECPATERLATKSEGRLSLASPQLSEFSMARAAAQAEATAMRTPLCAAPAAAEGPVTLTLPPFRKADPKQDRQLRRCNSN